MTKASDTQVGGTHYKDMGDYQPWDVLKHWLTQEEYRGWQKGNAIVYLARESQKGGDQDIAKAAHHLQKLIEVMAEADAVIIPPPPEYDPASVALTGAVVASGGWIEWRGGKCPVPPKTEVEYLLRSGLRSEKYAGGLLWDHTGGLLDIIAYKIINPTT